MADFAAIFDSDSDESDFSGFSSVASNEGEDSDVGEVDPDRENGWTNRLQPPTIEAFHEQPGPNLPEDFDPVSATPLAYFLLLFPMELISHIVVMTNEYAAWRMEQPDGGDNRWEDVSLLEMRAFLAVNILMGINMRPDVSLYWSSDPNVASAAIASIMTCNRYQRIMKYLHVSDRRTEPARGHPDYDRLYKVRPILDAVANNFRRYYTLSREVSVDEAMIAFTGRLTYRQYMPAKPIKRGVKVWMLCDARTSFLSRFDVYLGRQEGTEHGLGYNVVMKLSDHIRHTFRWIFIDNFFTGVKLLQDLLSEGLYACGTVRCNRKGFPRSLKKPATVRNRGDFKILQQRGSNLTATVWRDKRLVHHLSTVSNPTQGAMAQRRVGPQVINLTQPHSVQLYNQFMGGVDLHDQHRCKYDVGRKGKKAWRYLFWFALNCSIVNAFIMYDMASQRTTSKKRYTHLDFRRELINELLGGFKKRKRPTPEPRQQPLMEMGNIMGHVHCRLGDKRRVCKYHAKHLRTRKETVFGCDTCKVHLCQDGCHALWHNQVQ